MVASLVDMRGDEHRERADAAASALGRPIDFVSLATGRVVLPEGMAAAVNALEAPKLNSAGTSRGEDRRLVVDWPADVPEGGRHGFLRSDRPAFDEAVRGVADASGVANAQGEVSEVRYNAFGEVLDSTAYTGRITLASAGR